MGGVGERIEVSQERKRELETSGVGKIIFLQVEKLTAYWTPI